jgi:hypothetical protein
MIRSSGSVHKPENTRGKALPNPIQNTILATQPNFMAVSVNVDANIRFTIIIR